MTISLYMTGSIKYKQKWWVLLLDNVIKKKISFSLPFILVGWNVDTMAGVGSVILDHELEAVC